ncbi:Hpt domain-containing protein [uncultured Maribacter sp.]|uniref:Hpt domain-containing protein n=1 Tax=uncultured Maribacter sp. TaxID=431308 RepID=UPI00263141AE|nr:Hpt domain-containing protein [uncultured Maribacter sp.]
MEQPNLNYIKELSGNDKAFELKFLDIVKGEFPVEKQEYISCSERKDFKGTAEIVHKLKHKFNILGLEKGYKLAVAYEEELKRGSNKLKDDFLRVLVTIENYILTV